MWTASSAHPELHHREGDVGLDADDDRQCAPEASHLGDVAQCAGPERVEDVESRHVDDHTAGAVPAYLLDELLLESEHLRVVEGSVDRCDQV